MMNNFFRCRFVPEAGAITGGGTAPGACFDVCKPAAGYTQKIVIQGFDWGPAVTATIIRLEDAIQADSVRAGDFTVVEKKEAFDWAAMAAEHNVVSSPRKVLDAYACTSCGDRTTLPTQYIRLELSYGPNTGIPFCYDFYTSKNTWCAPYELSVSLAANPALTTIWGNRIASLSVDPVIRFEDALLPQLGDFHRNGKFAGSDGKELRFAYYTPALQPGRKAPLVIWLHGAGEGGADARIALLGNKIAALIGQEFQSALGGAYVLAPQTPGFWMEYDEEGHWQDNPGTASVYTKALRELIQAFVDKFTVDADRIIIGGCSNGGYMTMNMVLQYPDVFAAAYPICEAYKDSGITDKQLEGIRNLPIWFTYAQNDTVVPPADYEAPTIERLRAINPNLRTSVFADVHDTSGLYTNEDGTPYQYQGHWSWFYFFNNECVDDTTGENLWAWLGKQHK